jgi:predicted nucleic acid-binding protein
VRPAIADTSVFIARESGRPLDIGALPDSLQVSVITIGELRAGVLAATDLARRNLRLATLTQVLAFDPLPVDHDVAEAWALLRVQLRDAGRRMPVNDSWIAATAMAHGLAVATQDDDYEAVDGLEVIRV